MLRRDFNTSARTGELALRRPAKLLRASKTAVLLDPSRAGSAMLTPVDDRQRIDPLTFLDQDSAFWCQHVIQVVATESMF